MPATTAVATFFFRAALPVTAAALLASGDTPPLLQAAFEAAFTLPWQAMS
jgi:hypothetical protein